MKMPQQAVFRSASRLGVALSIFQVRMATILIITPPLEMFAGMMAMLGLTDESQILAFNHLHWAVHKSMPTSEPSQQCALQ